MKKLAFIATSLTAFSCMPSCIQRYDPPHVATPSVDAWKTKQDEKPSAECPTPEQVLVEASFVPYWKIFNDPVLDQLEYQSIKESPKVQMAVARLEEAMAHYGITRSSLFPQISLDVTAARERVSKTEAFPLANAPTTSQPVGGVVTLDPIAAPPPCIVCPPPPTPAAAKVPTHYTALGIVPVLTYELDFWGKNWQAAQTALQQVKAEQEELQNTLLQLTTSLADAYLQVRTYDRELDILEKTRITRTHNYDLNKTQFTAGLIDDLAVEQAKSDLESVLASIEDTKRLRALEEHRLAELAGQPASTFTLEKQDMLPALPTVASGIPSQMLERRPDIRQAKALIEAARLNVGVAKTGYFPDFTVTLDYGFMSSKANKLFKWKSHVWYAAVEAVTPLFTAGLISSQIDYAIAQYKQYVGSYLDTVLTAFEQVEDALFSIDATKKQLEHLMLDVEASQKAYNVADTRYRMGLENYILVVNTERTLLDAQRTAIQIVRSQYSNTITLINSLGGYWDNPK